MKIKGLHSYDLIMKNFLKGKMVCNLYKLLKIKILHFITNELLISA